MKYRRLFNVLIYLRHLLFAETFSIIIVALAFMSLLLSALSFVICGNWEFSMTMDEEKVGQYGDFVGGFIGTVLAFAASLLYLLALKEQRKDVRINQQSLQKQTEEFQNQVSELQKSRRAFQKQLEMMHLQQFENNFYSYFNIYLGIKSSLIINNSDGQSLLKTFLNNLSDKLDSKSLKDKDEYEAYNFASQKYCEEVIAGGFFLAHYFRTFYRLMSIAVSAPVDSQSEKMQYVKIIRSQLSEEELLILYYNSHSRYAGQSQKLLYEYNILKHLSPLHKYEIANRFSSKDKLFLIKVERFYDYVSPKIKNFINLICDNVDEQCEEYMYEPVNVAIKLEYNDEICVSIVNVGGYEQFQNLGEVFSYLLFDLIFNSQLIGDIGKIQRKDGVFPNTVFEQKQYVIDGSKIRKIVLDKDDGQ